MKKPNRKDYYKDLEYFDKSVGKYFDNYLYEHDLEKYIEHLESKVNNGVLDDVSNSKEQKPIKHQCLFCNRSFKRKIPHNCKGGFRKRKIEWLPIYE
jgi:hypothetical protein